jgi:hypothetical protein
MLPALSCAYQSSVTSISLPRSVTTSWTTLAVTPFAIRLVLFVTVTTTRCLVPSESVSR